MSSQKLHKYKKNQKPKNDSQEKINIDNQENNIKLIKRTLENNTHIVLEDSKLKNITSWRKSEKKFLQNLIFNILSLGILHLISLYHPKLYLKLYCNPWPPKECDFFLVENIYGQFTLCSKIHKKRKNINDTSFNNGISKENIISSSLINYNNKNENYIIRNLTYSFKYKSVTYEYQEETNEIIPVYMNLSKMTNKNIFNFFNDGLSTENITKKFEDRYGKNEYYINLGLPLIYFRNIELIYLLFILLIQAVNLFFKDPLSFLIFFGITCMLLFLEYLFTKSIIYSIYPKEYTLDGEKYKIKVKRKHKIVNNTEFYYEINNCDLLPGDILYLKSNDVVPCDCLILEGECIVNENSLNGSLDIFKKKSLENNNEQFNYEFSKINILYHGMKIVKSISKLNEGYISVLCLNTGPNTYKANQYSNILYLLERKVVYKKAYEMFGEGRKLIAFLILIMFFLSLLLGIIYIFSLDVKLDFKSSSLTKLLYINLIRLLCKSFMPVYFLTNSIIYFIGLFHLKSENIFCFEKSKLTVPSKINTIFFGKTGILCENSYEINGYHPIYINSHRGNSISFRTYKSTQYKEMNSQLLNYYKEYLFKCQNNSFNLDFNPRHGLRGDINHYSSNKNNTESNECITLFLECLLSCNNIEKYNTDIFGNYVETSFFKNMKWDIKSYRFNNNMNNNKNDDINNYPYINEINNENSTYICDNKNIIDRNINDIYPNNYYKITESYKKEKKIENRPILSRFNSKFYINQMKKKSGETNNSSNNNVSEFSLSSNPISNFIQNDISKSHIISYKLRIYKRFIKSGSLNSSAIVFNFITKELRFMTKGIPEEILDKCDKNSIPDNFDNVISIYRRKGFIIIICASKIISVEEYKDSNNIEEYMNNLTFCGFITLKNKLKKEIKNSIKDLKLFDCNLIISSGDNVFNCLPIGFDSNIIENKNIFSFDKEEKRNRIIISKIYNVKKEEEKNEEKNANTSFDKLSRQTMSKLSNNYSNSPFIKGKEMKSIRGKKEINKDNFSLNQYSEDNNDNKNENIYEINKYTPVKKINKQSNIKLRNKFGLSIEINKNNEKEKTGKYYNYTDLKNIKKEDKINSKINNISPLNFTKNKIHSEFKDNQDSSTYRKFIYNEIRNKPKSNLQKYFYYPGIFEDNQELKNNCIYCISGKAFRFLYNNKEKKQCKKILEKIYQNCKIFYEMSSFDKSLVIDYYRENPNSCICTIGKYPNDFDAMMTSNVGITLNPPKNLNTILSHFYSGDSSILSIKKIIREGRTISENILLLKITCFFYTLILNSYILCCFMMEVGIINGQLNFLEICFLILSISAFTVQYDYNTSNSNPLIQNRILYNGHYAAQVIGMFALKVGSIYMLRKFYIDNDLLQKTLVYRLFITDYFILCVEQLFSTFFVFNYICFYRKHPLSNYFFVFFNLGIFLYFVSLITLNSSNYKLDIFNITDFEFNENLIDSFDDQNRMKCFTVCAVDFFASFLYSRIVYFIFNKLAKNKSNICK